MFLRVRLKLTASLVLLFIILYTATSLLIYGITERMTITGLDNILDATAQPLADEVLTSFDRGRFPSDFVTLTRLATLYPKVSAVVLRDALGNVIANTSQSALSHFPYRFSQLSDLQTDPLSGHHQVYRTLTIHLENSYGTTMGYLQVAMNVAPDEAALARLVKALLATALAGVLLSGLAGYYMSRLSLRPVVASWSRQQQFVADASHELRTPLSIMRLNLDLVLSHKAQRIADNEEWLLGIHEEMDRLSRITNDLLTLARADAGTSFIHPTLVNALDITRQVVRSLDMAAQAKNLALDLLVSPETTPGEWLIFADQDRLHQLVTILTENAIKYTQCGQVTVSITKHNRFLTLSVRDTGIGIAKDQLIHIFERFYRADDARRHTIGGHGLGLSIAMLIAKAHHGTLKVTSAPDCGSEFTVTLPMDAPRGMVRERSDRFVTSKG